MPRHLEIVQITDDGAERVLTRTVPNKYRKRWEAVRQFAKYSLDLPLRESPGNPRGLTFAVESAARPGNYVGVRECA